MGKLKEALVFFCVLHELGRYIAQFWTFGLGLVLSRFIGSCGGLSQLESRGINVENVTVSGLI